MHCANFPRHLGRLITRCLTAHPDGAVSVEISAAILRTISDWLEADLPQVKRVETFSEPIKDRSGPSPQLAASGFRPAICPRVESPTKRRRPSGPRTAPKQR